MMQTLKQYLIAGAFALAVLAGGGVVWSVYSPKLQKAREELSKAQAELEVQRVVFAARGAADRVREARIARVNRNHEEASHVLEQVAEKHRAWADEPVPDDVAGVLRDTARNAYSGP